MVVRMHFKRGGLLGSTPLFPYLHIFPLPHTVLSTQSEWTSSLLYTIVVTE